MLAYIYEHFWTLAGICLVSAPAVYVLANSERIDWDTDPSGGMFINDPLPTSIWLAFILGVMVLVF
jgi:hypothetical protein